MFRSIHIVDVYTIHRFRCEPGWRVARTAHGFPELNYVLSGRLYTRAGGRTTIAAAGDVVFCPDGLLHESWIDHDQPLETVWIPFGGEFDGKAPKGVVVHHDTRGRIGELMQWMQENQREAGANQEEQRTFLKAILLDFDRRKGSPSRPKWFGRVREHVQQHLAEALSVEALARIAGLSRYRFLHAYKRASGVTPMADVRAMRVHKARQLLLSTALPMKTIAEQTGLGDASTLSHAFRRTLNTAPSQFRR